MATTSGSGQINGYSDLLAQSLLGAAETELLSSDSDRLTRGQIAARVGEESGRLRELGVGPERVVALRFDPSVDAVIAILAVLAAGAAYLPLDPRHGDQRIDQILGLIDPHFLIDAQGTHRRREPGQPAESQGLDDLAYIISTSGSTGKPKAPMLEQRGLVPHTLGMIEVLGLGDDDVVLQTAPPSFDIAVWQSTTPIIAGARLHIANAEQRLNPRELWKVIVDEQITTLELVPSMLRVLIDMAPPADELAIRRVITTGEAIDGPLVHRWVDRFEGVPLLNMYGPAECTITASVHELTASIDPSEPVPIGTAFPSVELRVVDENREPVTDGATGEIQVCGDLVGRGYWNDPERTDEVFGQYTATNGDAVRTYDTGDLGYVDDDGALRFVGRKDFQVQVRGNRVELGEIESVIAQQPRVNACVVTSFEDDSGRLAAHIEADEPLDRAAIRDAVAAKLPSYMVPSAIVEHGRLPLNANGKIDRKALPAPSSDDLLAQPTAGRLANTPTERAISRSWTRLLGIPNIAVDQDFFDLGGTSLLAVVCIDDLERELGCEIATSMFISASTIEGIAASLDTQLTTRMAGSGATDEVGLVQLQHDPTGVPVFLHPGEAVSALGMVELGRLIRPGQSVYVFEPPRPEGTKGVPLEVHAQRCREAIARVHPRGSVAVGGFCMGGDIAWEIAAQRRSEGLAVAGVFLLQTERIDRYPTWPETVTPAERRRHLLRHRLRFERVSLQSKRGAHLREHLLRLVLGKSVAKISLPLEKALRERLPTGWFGRPSVRLRQQLWIEADQQAYEHGWQPSKLDCPATVVRVAEQPPGVIDDELLGWSGESSAVISSHTVPGFHWSILQRPNVVEVAAAISDELARFARVSDRFIRRRTG